MAAKKWNNKDVFDLTEAMASKIAKCGYQLTIDPTSFDTNQLRIYLVPIERLARDPLSLLLWLSSKFGLGKSDPIKPATPAPVTQVSGMTVPQVNYTYKILFTIKDLQIYCFVI